MTGEYFSTQEIFSLLFSPLTHFLKNCQNKLLRRRRRDRLLLCACEWVACLTERTQQKKASGEIADFYNLIKCKYNGCEAEHKDKKVRENEIEQEEFWVGNGMERKRRIGW